MRTVAPGWRDLKISNHRYWIRDYSGVLFLLGMGPACGEGVSADRLRGIMKAPESTLRAIRFGDQIHGRVIASLAEEPLQPFSGVASVGRCDGLVTDVIGVGVAVWTADCVPVLLAGGGVVAAVHAGWRGAAAGIVRRAIRRFEIEYGVPPDHIEAVLGPAVASCHYEVGEEVITALADDGLPEALWRRGRRVDLRDFLANQLSDLGLDEASILRIGPCTACDSELASFRRDGEEAGRQVAVVALLARERPLS